MSSNNLRANRRESMRASAHSNRRDKETQIATVSWVSETCSREQFFLAAPSSEPRDHRIWTVA